MRSSVVLLLLLPFSAQSADLKIEVIAHRGASHEAPENTVTAMKLAWRQHADASELDVYLSKDAKAVVIHDGDTRRVGGVKKKVSEQSLAELKALDVGKWKGKQFAGERIPTLAEMLAAVAKGKRVFVEVKCGPEIIPELDRLLRASGLKPKQTPIISFNAKVVAEVKKARPDLPAYWIVGLNAAKGKKPPTAESLIAKAKAIGADGLDLSANAFLTEELAHKIKEARLKLYVWTVNDVKLARRMIALGVDGITTDRPGWLRQQLAK